MVNQAQKRRMQEYVASKLVGSGSGVVSIAEGKIDSIVVPDVGTVLLVNREFPNDGLRQIYNRAREVNPNVAVVFYKDGSTFFRNAAHGEEGGLQGVRYKGDLGLSLKLYSSDSSEAINRIITLRPEEKFVKGLKQGWVQYYQPESSNLEEGIETFRFLPVTLDYSHVPAEERVGDVQEVSKRWNIWDEDKRKHFNCPLKLEKGYLLPRA
jgi:hypothetical protein